MPLIAVPAVFTMTLWLRLVGATASGWLADRIGRKTPLMISILWYSVCNFVAGFSPTFLFLFVCRALLGIGMGAEWPAGAALAMEIVAGPFARLHERHAARLVGPRLPVVERDLRAALRLMGLARHADARHRPGAGGSLGPQVRQGTRGLEGEPRRSSAAGAGIPRSAAADLPPADASQHAHRVPVDGERFRHLLHGVRAVRDASAKGPAFRSGHGGAADRARQRGDLPRELLLGFGRG